jgi:hypothetical protein
VGIGSDDGLTAEIPRAANAPRGRHDLVHEYRRLATPLLQHVPVASSAG